MSANRILKFINKQQNKNVLISTSKKISYIQLTKLIKRIEIQLQKTGLKKKDIIALSLPGGIENLVILLAIANNYICMPINPDMEKNELSSLLARSGAKAIIYSDTSRKNIVNTGILHISINVENFTIKLESINKSEKNNQPKEMLSSSVMFLLTTSGTTSKPKFVSLTISNIEAGLNNLIKIYKLTSSDACLNVMPFFHVHGLMTALSTLKSGGSLICEPFFNGKNFFILFKKFNPTWFTGSPIIHCAIIRYIENNLVPISNRLRFIRSSSAPLPTSILERLEKKFKVPVSQSYGMTEATLQITANPLLRRNNKIKSVGIPIGVQIIIVDKNYKKLSTGKKGEILIKGKSVIKKYYLAAEDNKKSFINGWLKTGDVGYVDEDGYLYICGRIKEMINKGGENISPKEIDEILEDHPAVDQAAAFSVPHPTLGEDINAAVVLKNQKNRIKPEEIRDYLFGKISKYKIPTRIFIVKKMPKTATGKIIRNKLSIKINNI